VHELLVGVVCVLLKSSAVALDYITSYSLPTSNVVHCSRIIYGTASCARMEVIYFCVTRVPSHSTRNALNWKLFLMESGVVQYVLVYIIHFLSDYV